MQDALIFNEREEAGAVILTARPTCEVDHHTARKIRERIDARLYEVRPKILELDFGSVGFMDSSGIGLIMGRCESAAAVGCAVRLCSLSPRLLRILRLSGLEKIKNLTLG